MRHKSLVASVLLAALGLLGLGCSDSSIEDPSPDSASPHRDYLGRYRVNDDLVLVVSDRGGLLTFLPRFWHDPRVLEPVAEDRFRSSRNPEIEITFRRDATGAVSELEASGNEEIAGRSRRLSPGERLPVEALLDGDADEALRLLDLASEGSAERALGLAGRLLRSFPSRRATAARFLDSVAERFPAAADVHEGRGVAWVGGGDRDRALAAFRRTAELDGENLWARLALRHLDPEAAGTEEGEEEEGWRIPFPLADIFRAPAAAEIGEVRRRWRERDLSPQGVRVEELSALETDHGAFRQRLLSHHVHGEIHHAAVLVPADAEPGCCPVVLDVRGISWDYQPRRVTAGLGTLQILGEAAVHLQRGAGERE